MINGKNIKFENFFLFYSEKIWNINKCYLALRFIIIPIFIFLLIIVFPFYPWVNFNIVNNIEKIIERKEIYEDMNNALFYLYLIFLSPFFYRNILKCTSKVNKVSRYALFIIFIYPLIFPLYLM